ncbi:hypothetical protein JZU54_03405, partial [bacterium]|nr:hypothetical protein [bacterium]
MNTLNASAVQWVRRVQLMRCAALLSVAVVGSLGLMACSDNKPAFKGVDITGADYAKTLNLVDQHGQVR